jgi:hypothetical protein
MADGNHISINRDSPSAAEAAQMAREMVTATLTTLDAALGFALEKTVKRVFDGLTQENLAEREELLGCLLASLARMPIHLGTLLDDEHDQQPGTAIKALMTVMEQNGDTF